MDRFTIERFVAATGDCPLPLPQNRGRHDLAAGSRSWVDNRSRSPGPVVLQYVESGTMRVRWQGRLLEARGPAAVLVAFAEDSQYGRDDRDHQGYRSVWLNLDGHGLVATCHGLRADAGPVWPDAGGRIALALRPLLAPSALHLSAPALARLAGEALVALWEQRRTAAPAGPAARVLSELAADPFRSWDLAALAAAHGCSRSQVFRLARARWGMSAKRWLDGQRTRRAVELLDRGEMRVAAVARAVGYRSPQVLGRRLRAALGHGPRRRG
jgi:AraC-like DNA-binding protein